MPSGHMVPSRIAFTSVLDGGSLVTLQDFLVAWHKQIPLSLSDLVEGFCLHEETFSTKQINISVSDLDDRSSITRQ